jgi:hypothetical protein
VVQETEKGGPRSLGQMWEPEEAVVDCGKPREDLAGQDVDELGEEFESMLNYHVQVLANHHGLANHILFKLSNSHTY